MDLCLFIELWVILISLFMFLVFSIFSRVITGCFYKEKRNFFLTNCSFWTKLSSLWGLLIIGMFPNHMVTAGIEVICLNAPVFLHCLKSSHGCYRTESRFFPWHTQIQSLFTSPALSTSTPALPSYPWFPGYWHHVVPYLNAFIQAALDVWNFLTILSCLADCYIFIPNAEQTSEALGSP